MPAASFVLKPNFSPTGPFFVEVTEPATDLVETEVAPVVEETTGDVAESVEAPVDLGVDAADEKRRDGGQPGEVAARGLGVLDAVEEGVDHLGVAAAGEDQRHVDADALG